MSEYAVTGLSMREPSGAVLERWGTMAAKRWCGDQGLVLKRVLTWKTVPENPGWSELAFGVIKPWALVCRFEADWPAPAGKAVPPWCWPHEHEWEEIVTAGGVVVFKLCRECGMRTEHVAYVPQPLPDGAYDMIAQRPHSRACGWRKHEHGLACHTNCPSCGGRA